MEEKKSHAHLYAWLILLLLICGASIFKFFIEPRLTALPEEPVMGQIGSTHTHASLYILIGNKRLNFCESKYMLASQAVHFEDNNCHVIHKHATGVTLQTFLKSINVLLTRNCIETSDEQKYCADGTNLLQAVINGMEVPIESLAHYELMNNDHILINYGPETGTMLRFKYNQVPSIPVTVNEPGVQDFL